MDTGCHGNEVGDKIGYNLLKYKI